MIAEDRTLALKCTRPAQHGDKHNTVWEDIDMDKPTDALEVCSGDALMSPTTSVINSILISLLSTPEATYDLPTIDFKDLLRLGNDNVVCSKDDLHLKVYFCLLCVRIASLVHVCFHNCFRNNFYSCSLYRNPMVWTLSHLVKYVL